MMTLFNLKNSKNYGFLESVRIKNISDTSFQETVFMKMAKKTAF